MSQVQAVLLDDRDAPLKLEINSWITLMPGTRGGHARDALKHGGSSIRGSYKARVLKFQIRSGCVSLVLVEHAYMRRELDLDPIVPLTLPNACNCKCHISNLTNCNFKFFGMTYSFIIDSFKNHLTVHLHVGPTDY